MDYAGVDARNLRFPADRPLNDDERSALLSFHGIPWQRPVEWRWIRMQLTGATKNLRPSRSASRRSNRAPSAPQVFMRRSKRKFNGSLGPVLYIDLQVSTTIVACNRRFSLVVSLVVGCSGVSMFLADTGLCVAWPGSARSELEFVGCP